MDYFLSWLLSSLLLYKYFALFGIVFSAALIVPWPENTLLLATGAFASQGYFSLTAAFLVCLVANVIGDSIGYFLTFHWGNRVIKEHHLKKYVYIDRLNGYVKAHAGLTILLTRFVGTVGPLVNYLSGLIGVSFSKFLIFDIIGNTLDFALFLGAGYLLGNVWQNFSGITDTIGWILLVVIAINVAIHVFWKPAKPQA
jgi:membrane-associated protein